MIYREPHYISGTEEQKDVRTCSKALDSEMQWCSLELDAAYTQSGAAEALLEFAKASAVLLPEGMPLRVKRAPKPSLDPKTHAGNPRRDLSMLQAPPEETLYFAPQTGKLYRYRNSFFRPIPLNYFPNHQAFVGFSEAEGCESISNMFFDQKDNQDGFNQAKEITAAIMQITDSDLNPLYKELQGRIQTCQNHHNEILDGYGPRIRDKILDLRDAALGDPSGKRIPFKIEGLGNEYDTSDTKKYTFYIWEGELVTPSTRKKHLFGRIFVTRATIRDFYGAAAQIQRGLTDTSPNRDNRHRFKIIK